MMRWLALVFCVAFGGVAAAGEAGAGVDGALKGPDILEQLAGKSVRGAYADGTSFTETFWPDGRDTYWDPALSATGHWSVESDLMCFDYEAQSGMTGGCFHVVKSAPNCFDFYSATATDMQDGTGKVQPRYVARASADGVEGKCPVDLQA